VDVTINMTANPEWDQAFAELARAGAHIRLYADDSSALYIHARAIVADASLPGQQVLVGSQNFSVASLDYSRELGILTSTPAVVAVIAATLADDYADATPYSPGTTPPQQSQARLGAPPPQASTTPPTTRTTSTCTPTSPTRTPPRPPRANCTHTRPTAPAMR
jgi:phosphatidylserine/phosphatidylglycerophosphate/cardiolipin synthase-like enzyme